jgi:hypothetical protein
MLVLMDSRGLTRSLPASITPLSLPPSGCPAGLLALKAVVQATGAAYQAMADTWVQGTNPCHDYLPNCTMCDIAAAAGTCGSSAPSSGPAPARYCNWKLVSCKDGRVERLQVDGGDAVLTSLPPLLNKLDKLRSLGGWHAGGGCSAAWLRGCSAAWLRGCSAAWLRGWLRGTAWLAGLQHAEALVGGMSGRHAHPTQPATEANACVEQPHD